MSHTDIYIIIGTACFVSTFGVYVFVRKIRQYTHPPTNLLTRRNHDIELQQFNVTDIDLNSLPEYPTSQAVINHLPIRWDEYNLPRYSQLTEYIHCPLENCINLDFILWFILGVLFFFLIKYYLLKLSNNNSRTVFTNGISTEVITFRNNYQEILSSKLNKGDRGFFF